MTQLAISDLADLTGYAVCTCGSTDLRAQSVPGRMPAQIIWCRGCGAKATYKLTIDKYGMKSVEVER